MIVSSTETPFTTNTSAVFVMGWASFCINARRAPMRLRGIFKASTGHGKAAKMMKTNG